MGTNFGADFYGVVPDMLNFAKAVTNGVIPLGGVICRDKLYDAMMKTDARACDRVLPRLHLPGPPVACAAAIATPNLFKQENLFERAGPYGARIGRRVPQHLQAGPPNGCIRMGLAAAVELAPLPGLPGKRAYEIFLECLPRARTAPAGDVLVISPPFIVRSGAH